MDAHDIDRHLPLKPKVFHILLSLMDGVAHGYGIRRAVAERTQDRLVLAAGTLYETLQRMERDGYIAAATAPAGEEPNPRWRFYQATALGRSVLLAEVRRLESDVAAARALLPEVR